MQLVEDFNSPNTLGPRLFHLVGTSFGFRSVGTTLLPVPPRVSVFFYRHGQRLNVDLNIFEPGELATIRGGFDQLEITANTGGIYTFDVLGPEVTLNRVYSDPRDRAREQALAARAFHIAIEQAAVAGQNGHVQLINNGPTARRAHLRTLTVWTGAAQSVQIYFYNGVLTTFHGFPPCKFIGQAPALCEVRRQGNVGILPLAGNLFFATTALFAGTLNVPLDRPVVFDQGQSVTVVGATVNILVGASFEFDEELRI